MEAVSRTARRRRSTDGLAVAQPREPRRDGPRRQSRGRIVAGVGSLRPRRTHRHVHVRKDRDDPRRARALFRERHRTARRGRQDAGL